MNPIEAKRLAFKLKLMLTMEKAKFPKRLHSMGHVDVNRSLGVLLFSIVLRLFCHFYWSKTLLLHNLDFIIVPLYSTSNKSHLPLMLYNDTLHHYRTPRPFHSIANYFSHLLFWWKWVLFWLKIQKYLWFSVYVLCVCLVRAASILCGEGLCFCVYTMVRVIVNSLKFRKSQQHRQWLRTSIGSDCSRTSIDYVCPLYILSWINLCLLL